MKVRHVTLFSGEVFEVPQCIQRIDHRSTHGWQLRYGGTKLFSDHTSDGSGARRSLDAATKELLRRIAKLPAPTRLQVRPNHSKTSHLPVGISGPVYRLRSGASVHDCSLSVSIPVYGETAKRRSVYIGTENTSTPERFEHALMRAIGMRQKAEAQYQRAATKAKRQEATLIRAQQKERKLAAKA